MLITKYQFGNELMTKIIRFCRPSVIVVEVKKKKTRNILQNHQKRKQK